MARTVRDAAILLGVLAGVDADDPATLQGRGRIVADYTPFLRVDGLRGARIGVVRNFFAAHQAVQAMMNDALDTLKRQGATLVDPTDLVEPAEERELEVMLYELKTDLNAYLAKLGPGAPVRSLKEVIEFNERNREREMPYFGQDLFYRAEQLGPLTDQRYRNLIAETRRLARTEGIDAVMDRHRLDALVAPTEGPAWLIDPQRGDTFLTRSSSAAAAAGYPSISVPAHYVGALPMGVSFFGRAWSEPTLIKLAYAFEQATHVRKPPRLLRTV
jgi:amidase